MLPENNTPPWCWEVLQVSLKVKGIPQIKRIKLLREGTLLTFYFYFSPSCLPPSTSLLKFTLASEQILSMKGQEGLTPLVYLLKIWRSNNHCAHKTCGWFRAYTSGLSLPPSDSLGSQRKRKTELIKGLAVIKWKWAKMKGLLSTSKVQLRLGELTAGVPGSEVQTAEQRARHS